MSFDITGATRQLAEIEKEIKRLNGCLRQTRDLKKKIENDIAKYLEANRQQGVIINDMTILNEQRVVRKPLKKQEKDDRIKEVLGQSATPEMIEQIKNATRGNQVVEKKLIVQYEHKLPK